MLADFHHNIPRDAPLVRIEHPDLVVGSCCAACSATPSRYKRLVRLVYQVEDREIAAFACEDMPSCMHAMRKGRAQPPVDPDMPSVTCPSCKATATDWDGFGFMSCASCGYCTHPGYDGSRDKTRPMACTICGTPKPIELSDLHKIASLVLKLGRVHRATQHPDGQPESDTTHTLMLVLIAPLMARHSPVHLDERAVAMFAAVHELTEALAGDTDTCGGLSPEQRAEKERAEAAALEIICDDLAGVPWLTDLLRRYEAQQEREARFVRYVDKLMVRLTHGLNGCRPVIDKGHDIEWLRNREAEHGAELAERYPEFEHVRDTLADAVEYELARFGMRSGTQAQRDIEYAIVLTGGACTRGALPDPWTVDRRLRRLSISELQLHTVVRQTRGGVELHTVNALDWVRTRGVPYNDTEGE